MTMTSRFPQILKLAHMSKDADKIVKGMREWESKTMNNEVVFVLIIVVITVLIIITVFIIITVLIIDHRFDHQVELEGLDKNTREARRIASENEMK